MIGFADPWFLLLALFIPAISLWVFKIQKGRGPAMLFSAKASIAGLPVGWRVRLRHLPFALMMVALALLTVAAARPQSGRSRDVIKTEGIDIMLVLDISSSMAAEDFTPNNRLYAAKDVIKKFISERKGDRIGLVLFAGKAFTQCPLTVDYEVLSAFLERAEIGLIEDGTAIGMAVATGTNRLRDSKAKSKVMILLTDGVNNRGEIDPVTAAKLAKAVGLKIYTVGAGTNGYAPVPIRDPIFGTRRARMKVEIDEKTLEEVAEITGGQYYRATDAETLEGIYDKIDALEKTEVELEHYTEYTEYYTPFAVLGFVLIALSLMFEATILRKVN